MSPQVQVPFAADAISAVLDDWHGAAPSAGLLALVPEAERERIPALQEICRQRGVPLVGAVFPCLVTADGFSSEGVGLLRCDRAPAARLVDAGPDARTTAERIGSFVREALAQRPAGAERPTLFLVFDAMIPHVASVVEELFRSLSDEVAYAGVNAGSETFRPIPCLFDAEGVRGNAVWCVLLDGPAPVAIHGYAAPERTITATATEGNGIRSIDWRPAFDVYRERVRSDHGVELTRENFYQFAVHFPFGVLRACGDVVVRIPVVLADDGTLFCVGEVPPQAVLVLLDGPGPDPEATVRQVRDALPSSEAVLAFYCAGRRMHLGEAAAGEVRALAAGRRGLLGALSLGEIGGPDADAYPVFHNAAIVAAGWETVGRARAA